MKLLETLLENNSISVQRVAKNWKEAIKLSCDPLIKSGAILATYIDEIIQSTDKFGPYYIISDGLAMPHAASKSSVKKNCFSLLTLKNPIKFSKDDREVSILITLASINRETHGSIALPQVVALFEKQENIKKIAEAKTKDEIIDIIQNTDINKYLKEE